MQEADRVHSTPRRTASKVQPANVVKLNDYRTPSPKRVKQKSQYELYPLPFFNGKKRCTWDVTPTASYSADCETGKTFAIEFLKSCDGTYGWQSLLQHIVADMIRAGPTGRFPDGDSKVNGIVIGFMAAIGGALIMANRPSHGGGDVA